MIIFGFNPITLFQSILNLAFTTQSGQTTVLTYTATYTLTALAFLIPGKAGIWNVGANGQIYLGGITAGIFATFVPLPAGLWPLGAVLVGCLAGGLWGMIPGALEAYRHASSIVTTIMMNYIGRSLASFLLLFVIALRVKGVGITNNATFPQAATIPAIPFYPTSILVILAPAIAAGSMYLLYRTTLGYKIRATGMGVQPAEAKGINTRRTKVIAMLIGGALAGLVGVADVLGPGHTCGPTACLHLEWAEGWFGGEGFAGIAVALVAASNPIGSILAAFIFAVLVTGGAAVQGSGPTVYMFYAVQGLIILFMAAPNLSKMVLGFTKRRIKPRT